MLRPIAAAAFAQSRETCGTACLHPGLRMAARVLGFVLLAFGVYQAWETGHWQIGPLAMPLAFICWSLIPPERRS